MEYIIRKVITRDAEQLIRHKEIVTKENPDTLATPVEDHQLTVSEQEKLIEETGAEDLVLVAEADGRIVGLINLFQLDRKKFEHVCQFGISVQKAYSDHGIGGALVERVIEHAQNSKVLEKIILDVFSNNGPAIAFYENFGFQTEGRQVNQVKLEGGYTDLIQMALFVKTQD